MKASGPTPRPAPAPEVHRAAVMTWVALVLIAVGSAGGFLLDQDANPVAQGLLAVLAALVVMMALRWRWRSTRGRARR